jgi:DNA polymerase III sliding clamp (beta) subunit (PCNA family)
LILPKNAISELIRIFGTEEKVKFSFKKENGQAVFSSGNIALTTRVIEGEFQCIDRELNFIIGFSIDILNYHYNDYVLKVELLKCMV